MNVRGDIWWRKTKGTPELLKKRAVGVSHFAENSAARGEV